MNTTTTTVPQHETQWRTPLCEAFPTLREHEVLFAMPFNLTSVGEVKKTEGVLGATNQAIYLFNIETGEKTTLEFSLLTKFAINVGTGSVGIEYTDGGGVHALCTADMSMKIMYAYAVKLFNRRLKYGVLRPDGVNRRTTCTKCHRPYAPGATYCFACADKKKHFGWLWSFLKPYQFYIYLASVLFVVVTFLSILLPMLNARLIDNFIQAEDPPMFTQFLVAILSIVGVNLLVRVFRFLRRRAMLSAQIPLSTGLRETMFDKIQRLTMRNVNRRTAGSLI
ncbi:MAG: ABC transporter transmembrane domain-containing protein, partial [Oscillospiraceae bacterium]|nr:ABC transporter transmembrane domain-containing protein [Oscillospiraceae bacterium]